MLPQEILDVLRSILVHFGTLVIEPRPSLNLIPAIQCQTCGRFHDDLWSQVHCIKSSHYYCTSMTFSAMP